MNQEGWLHYITFGMVIKGSVVEVAKQFPEIQISG
jgi:hypothetical protein